MTKLNQEDSAFHEWSFPTIDNGYNTKEINSEEKSIITNSLIEVKKMQLELQEKIEYLDRVGLNVKKMLSDIDEQLLTNIVTIIRSSVKKIVLKELDLNEALLQEIILNTLEILNKENEALVVFISAEDHVSFTDNDALKHVEIKIDSTLARGDFIIKTQCSEIVAAMDQYLNTLFGV